MNVSTALFGTENARSRPISSRSGAHTSRNIQTLHDVLEALQDSPPPSWAMLKSTASRLVQFYGRPPETITIDAIYDDKDEFRDHLKKHRYLKNAIRSYGNFVRILIRLSRERGWRPSHLQIPEEWSIVLPQAQPKQFYALIRFLTKRGRRPATVLEKDLADWVLMRVQAGRAYASARRTAGALRRRLSSPDINPALASTKRSMSVYGIPLQEFPDPLQREVRDVLMWKQEAFVPERSTKDRVRAVTAYHIEKSFSRLFGFALNVQGLVTISCLSELITKEVVTAYIAWSLNVRKVRGVPLKLGLSKLCAALSQNPKYRHLSDPWFRTLLSTIPEESQGDADRRKEQRFLPYESIRQIPGLIREGRSRLSSDDPYAVARLVRDELLMLWLSFLPWRQRNIRECRIEGNDPNLYRAETAGLVAVTKPDWLIAAAKAEPELLAWQFRFSPDETKTHQPIHCILPKVLIAVLEEYLREHRPHLVRGSDPGTLFLNDDGRALTSTTLRNHVMRLTLRYAGRAVNPHLFRDIFAYMWLERCPEDYLTLSKLLWHRNINTTIRIYGRRFNESTALCRMERVLGS